METLGLDPDEVIEDGQGLFDAGLNWIGAKELEARLQSTVGTRLPATLVFDYPTIASLTTYLAKHAFSLPVDAPAATARPNGARQLTADGLETLSEEDAEALLLEQLRGLE